MRMTIYARIGDLDVIGVRILEVDAGDNTCEQCGHPWQEHHLCATSRPPTEGWIECPTEGCDCHQTWSVPPDTAAQLRAHYVTSPAE